MADKTKNKAQYFPKVKAVIRRKTSQKTKRKTGSETRAETESKTESDTESETETETASRVDKVSKGPQLPLNGH
jgi:hypothetical protein